MKRHIHFLFFFCVVILSKSAYGSSCCGSSAALPALITTGEKVKFNLSQTQSQIIGDVNTEGLVVFRRTSDRLISQTTSLQLSALLTETLQAGFGSSATEGVGAGDTTIYGAWEAYPEGSLSLSQLQGLYYTKLSLPTGKSIYQLEANSGTAVNGQGLANISFGQVMIYKYWAWDLHSNVSVGRYIEREFATGSGALTVYPSNNFDISLGGGHAWKNIRFGIDFALIYHFARTTRTAQGEQSGADSYWWPTTLSGSIFMANSSFLQLAYIDETLLGPVKNSNLNRSLGMTYGYRFF